MCQEVERRVPKPGSRGVCLKPCLCPSDIHIVCAALKRTSAKLETTSSAQVIIITLGSNKELWVQKKGKMDRRRGNIIFHHL